MPDYNPAVAAGIAPPQNNFVGTLNTLTNIQTAQAHQGLLALQQALQQRKFNGLQAATQAYAAGEDPVVAGLRGGLDPQDAQAFQSLSLQRRATGLNPYGVTPEAYGQTLNAAKTQAEIPGAIANSRAAQSGALKAGVEADAATAKQYGPAVLLNPRDNGAWSQLVNAHFDAVGGSDIERQAALNIKDPNQRTDGAIRYGAAASVPVQDLAKTFNIGGGQQPGQQTAQAGPQTTLRQPGEVKQAEDQAGYFSKLYAGTSAMGTQSVNSLNEARVARAAINAPGFYSGTAAPQIEAVKRLGASLGINPAGALPMELLHKVLAQSLQQQATMMRANAEAMGESGGRLFKQQIDLMTQGSQSTEISEASNNALTELLERNAKLNRAVSDMASTYRGEKGNQKPGTLDAPFEVKLRNYISDHPLISDAEMANPNLIADAYNARQHLKWTAANDQKNLASRQQQFDAAYGAGASADVIGK